MFRGFSPETMDFLWGIRMNNERSWFLAHKNDYMQYLYEPMKALGEAIFRPFQERSLFIRMPQRKSMVSGENPRNMVSPFRPASRA